MQPLIQSHPRTPCAHSLPFALALVGRTVVFACLLALGVRAATANEAILSTAPLNTDAASAGEHAAVAALGFNPDDPISIAAYREDVAQSSPYASLAAGDFHLDASWGINGVAGDRFAGPDEGFYSGVKAAKLPNGNIVVVSNVHFGDGNLYFGLTQLDSTGHRVAWANPNPSYASYSNQYIIYPKGNAALPQVNNVSDIKVYGNHIYVLATGIYGSGASLAFKPNIIRFNLDGSDAGWWYVSVDGPSDYARAMDIEANRLVVLASLNSIGFWTALYDLDSGGGLTNLRIAQFPSPPPLDYFTTNNTYPVDVAFRRIGGNLAVVPSSYYVLFRHAFTNGEVNSCLLAVNLDGTLDTGFPAMVGGYGTASGGGYCKSFHEPDVSPPKSYPVALTTNGWSDGNGNHEGIQVLASVARASQPGAGMWEFLDRSDHPTFGTNGIIVFGGCGHDSGGNDVGAGCAYSPNTLFRPTDLEYSGYDEIVSGSVTSTAFGQMPFVFRIQGGNGNVEQKTSFTSGYSGGGQFNSILARDANHLVAIGEARDISVSNAGARTQITVGMTNLDDVIFQDGFD